MSLTVPVYLYCLYCLYCRPMPVGVPGPRYSQLLGLAAFVPQMGLVLYAGLHYARDLPFAWLLQTILFVMFNKVGTGA